MIQIYSESLLIVGVTRANVNKLIAGKPIAIDLHKPVSQMVVMFGEDKPHILQQLETYGLDIPDAIRKDALADPL